ncbi:MAG: LytTR family DNA-binding domain-containing protein [Clostridium sp.]|nr:LytTR family DNA-binding domain-containing protein [Clostridium sp.]
MKISIVEDEKIHQDYVASILEKISKKQNCMLSLRVFESAEAFLFDFEEEKVDAVLLDIELKNMNGYELAREIRKTNSKIPIAFITGVKDYVFDGYKVDACGYILKPIDEESMLEIIKKIQDKLSTSEKSLMVKTKEGIVNLWESDINYVESADHSTIVNTTKGRYISSRKLSQWLEELSKDKFFKPHRCYIINLGLVEKIEKEYVSMKNDVKIPIARGIWKDLMKSYLNYRRKDYE